MIARLIGWLKKVDFHGFSWEVPSCWDCWLKELLISLNCKEYQNCYLENIAKAGTILSSDRISLWLLPPLLLSQLGSLRKYHSCIMVDLPPHAFDCLWKEPDCLKQEMFSQGSRQATCPLSIITYCSSFWRLSWEEGGGEQFCWRILEGRWKDT